MALFLPEMGEVEQLSERKTGVLLLNLGSPDDCEVPAVRRYLREFLSDRRVIEMPLALWRLILYGFILPFRPKNSGALYRKVWTDKGSPLIVHTQNLAKDLQNQINTPVYAAMSYGNPSVVSVVQQMKQDGITHIVALPLFPQYASSAAGAALDALWRALLKTRVQPALQTISAFYDFEPYIDALANNIKNAQTPNADMLLMSFHGIPLAQHTAGDVYKAQCYKTAQLLADKLNLTEKQYRVVFQSRFGRAKWIEPCTQDILNELPKQGIKNINICCPGFVCDCLETLEEIAISGKKIFINAGGERYHYIHCLNNTPNNVSMLKELLK
ncbi:MAG: ferrochelatase, partial [Neisseriaceae bacterium]|nr:ferrochelatase [Neisseriaceae bacterium]